MVFFPLKKKFNAKEVWRHCSYLKLGVAIKDHRAALQILLTFNGWTT